MAATNLAVTNPGDTAKALSKLQEAHALQRAIEIVKKYGSITS